MDKDIGQLSHETLTYMGCSPGVVGKINGRSPVVFSFNNDITLNLSMEDDACLLWTEVGEYSERLIDHYGAKILRQLLISFPCYENGKMFLSKVQEKLYLQAFVNEAAFESAQTFSVALQLFFEQAILLHHIVKE